MTLKFRAWLKKEKKMVDVDGITFLDGEVNSIRYAKLQSSFYEGIGFKLMQSTGVKDCDGKEIYEGDVVLPSCALASLVFWENGAFQVGHYGDMSYVSVDYEPLLVIGNIYENPELVKEVEK